MTVDTAVLWPLLQRLQERARQLEAEATALRAEVEQVAQTLDQPVAFFVIDGEEITISAGDVERVRAQMVKPRDQTALHELALLMKLRERDQSMSIAALLSRNPNSKRIIPSTTLNFLRDLAAAGVPIWENFPLRRQVLARLLDQIKSFQLALFGQQVAILLEDGPDCSAL